MNALLNTQIIRRPDVIRVGPWRERYDLELLEVIDSQANVVGVAPVVNGWVQIDAVVTHVPTPAEERAFFHELAALREERGSAKWFFVHKPPGLRLRFQLADERGHDLANILTSVVAWRAPWLGDLAFGSFFAQAELLDERYRETVDTLLTAAADELIDRVLSHAQTTNIDAWADFVLCFVEYFVKDRWFAWEALGRFQRMRSTPLAAATPPDCGLAQQTRLPDPRGILARFTARIAHVNEAGFGASLALLQTLNYIFNMWAIDQDAQHAILARARAMSAPELTH